MGRLIDADVLSEEIYSWGMNDYEPSDFTDAIDDAPTVEAIPIPKDATNGDMIKAMFPNITVRDSYYTYCVEVKLEYHSQYDTGLLFDKKWWNAPYKAESEG